MRHDRYVRCDACTHCAHAGGTRSQLAGCVHNLSHRPTRHTATMFPYRSSSDVMCSSVAEFATHRDGLETKRFEEALLGFRHFSFVHLLVGCRSVTSGGMYHQHPRSPKYISKAVRECCIRAINFCGGTLVRMLGKRSTIMVARLAARLIYWLALATQDHSWLPRAHLWYFMSCTITSELCFRSRRLPWVNSCRVLRDVLDWFTCLLHATVYPSAELLTVLGLWLLFNIFFNYFRAVAVGPGTSH